MAMAMGLLPRLYRQILRHAGRIDRAAHLKTLLYVHPVLRDAVAGPGSMGDLATGSGADERPSLSQFCKAFMGGEVFYHPLLREEHGLSNMSLRELVRGCFDSRRVRQPGEGGGRGGGGDGSAASTPLDRGFLALRLLSSTVAMGAGSSSPPPSSSSSSAIGGSLAHLRAALEAEGVRCDTIVEHAGGFAARHPQVSLGAGDFLHAHPCLVQGNLTRSVICMADHDDSSGSLGVVVNGPSPFVLEDDSPIALAAFSEAVQEAFAGKRIWVGGDVGMGSLYCIYRGGGSVGGDGDSGGVGGKTAAAAAAAAEAEPSQAAGARGLPEGEGGRETENAGAGPLSGDRCIGAVPGLYMQADLDLVAELILRGDLHRDDVRLFTGYCGWGPQQLRREVEMGTWHVLGAASDAHVFKALIGDPQLDLPALGGRHRGTGDDGSDGNGGGGHERVRPSHHHHHHDEHTGGRGEGGGGHAALHGSHGGSSEGGDAVDLCGAEWEVMDAAHRAQLSGEAVAFDEHAPEHEQLFNHHHHSVRRRRRPNADDTAVTADCYYYDDEEGEADVDALFRAGVVSREEFELIAALTDAHRGSGGRGGGGADGASPPHYNASVDFDDGAVVGGRGAGSGGGGGGGVGDHFDDHFDVDDFMGDDDGDNDDEEEDDDLGTDFLGFMGGMPGPEDDGPGSVFEMTKALWWAASVQDVDNEELRKAVEVFASPSEEFIERMDALYKV